MTDKAYAAFRDKSPIAAVVPPRPKAKSSGAGAAGTGAGTAKRGGFESGSREERLEGALRSLRKSLAEEGRVPNYMIFSDRTLHELVEKAPTDRAALLDVFGMGEVKATRFGSAILRTVAEASSLGDSVL
jgi:superfamily II DNA helicase RecQ